MQIPPLRKDPADQQQATADKHLHGACSAEEQKHVIGDNRHKENVENVGKTDIDDSKQLKQIHLRNAFKS